MPSPLETGSTAPTSLAHLIGQRQVIRQVEVALDAAQMDGRRFDHALLVGPPGLGKSAWRKSFPSRWLADSTKH